MRLIDADELIKDRVENDPVVIAANNASTVEPEPYLPPEPIQCAAMLVDRSFEYDTGNLQRVLGLAKKMSAKYYSVNELREIAEYLLVYCNHMEEDS